MIDLLPIEFNLWLGDLRIFGFKMFDVFSSDGSALGGTEFGFTSTKDDYE